MLTVFSNWRELSNTRWDTECYPSLALMVHSVFWLVWSHSDMESSSTHSVYSFESVETTVIVISCGRASSGLELISALDKALPMFDLRDTENYSSFLNTATCLLSVSLKTRILSFKKFTVILVAPHRKPKVGKFWLLSSTLAAMPSEVWNTECSSSAFRTSSQSNL